RHRAGRRRPPSPPGSAGHGSPSRNAGAASRGVPTPKRMALGCASTPPTSIRRPCDRWNKPWTYQDSPCEAWTVCCGWLGPWRTCRAWRPPVSPKWALHGACGTRCAMPAQFAFAAGDDRMARAAWSRIAEPRDQDAARLIRTLGAAEALHWLARAAANWCDPPGLSAGPRLRAGLRRWAPRLENLDPRRELEMLARCGGHLLVPSDPQWPQVLAELGDDAPPCLWVRGDPAVWERQCVALIGARACSS